MPRLNLEKLQLENIRQLKRYERFGVRLFRRALERQANDFKPEIMQNAYIEFYQFAFVDSAKREYTRIRNQEGRLKDFTIDEFFLNTWKAWIGEWVKDNLGLMIARINDNTLRQIQAVLAEATGEGLNPFQTQRLIRERVGFNKARALAIARTESTRANAMGKQRSAEDWKLQTGTSLCKMWVHGGSRDPRISHLEANGSIVKDGDLFPIDSGLYLPGDKNAPASSTVNCSCTVVFMSERFVKRNYPEQANDLGLV